MTMESKDIVFTGLGRAVSDLDIPDGELSVSHNIIRDNGSMKPIWMPGDMITLESGENLVYVHRTSEYRNYIVNTNGTLYFFTDDNPSRTYIASVPSDMKDIIAVGNTLVVASDEGLQYILYKDEGYKNLGTKPPEIVLRFHLESELMKGELFKIDDVSSEVEGNVVTIGEADIDRVGVMELGAVNKLIADATKDNKIVYPCFVRYAYRMYDGTSYIMHSAPILLVPNTELAPVVCANYPSEVTEDGWRAMANVSSIKFSITDIDLSQWSDVIQSVDIFMSEQISTRNLDSIVSQIKALDDTDAVKSMNYGFFASVGGSVKSFGDMAREEIGEGEFFGALYDDSMIRKDYRKIIRDTSNFYKVRSLDIKNLKTEVNLPLFEDETGDSASGVNLSSITLEERLSDDYQTHDVLYTEDLHVYNGRLNISGVKRGLFEGYGIDAMVADVPSTYASTQFWTVYTHLKKNGREVVVKNGMGWLSSFYPLYLFYPDTDAYKMTIIKGMNIPDGSEMMDGYVLDLTSHTGLNGAVYFNGLNPAPTSIFRRLMAPKVTDSVVDVANKVYTSEINNPFYFPLAGINTVGSGEILGIATVTKALSQGQFGQFPLYVFATDGVWAMEVGDDGLYRSIKPISRDVCINGISITQTDNAVLFVSEKGVMMIDGSEISCISDMMNGRSFDISSVSMLPDVMEKESIPSDLRGIHDFMDYARVGRMAYDYPNGRVILYAEGMDYVYVFSLTSLTWATLGASIDNAVNDYPDTYVQTGTGVKNLSTRIDYDNVSLVKTLLVTRPLKLGDDGYKTVYEMVSRGAMDRKKGALLLWGSYDGIDYTLIADATGNRIYRTGGTAYRYYRIGVVGEMPVGESLSMVSMLFRRRYGNKLR